MLKMFYSGGFSPTISIDSTSVAIVSTLEFTLSITLSSRI